MTNRLIPHPGERTWLGLHLGLGLAWCAVLASRAPGGSGPGATGFQVFWMLLAADALGLHHLRAAVLCQRRLVPAYGSAAARGAGRVAGEALAWHQVLSGRRRQPSALQGLFC
ncbi:MAG: hypothetical protein ACK5Q6_04860 [Cyanobacteriota bacterium]